MGVKSQNQKQPKESTIREKIKRTKKTKQVKKKGKKNKRPKWPKKGPKRQKQQRLAKVVISNQKICLLIHP